MCRDDAYACRYVLIEYVLMFFDMICGFFQDALFAAIAAIGFAAISNPRVMLMRIVPRLRLRVIRCAT